LNSFHQTIHVHGRGAIDQLDAVHNDITASYSEGKISNEQYANLKTEISVHYEDLYKKRIESGDDNIMLLDNANNEIKDACAKGKISEQHFVNLKNDISILYLSQL
jgi:uncharacterized membrane protein